jgi:hypothetical protein
LIFRFHVRAELARLRRFQIRPERIIRLQPFFLPSSPAERVSEAQIVRARQAQKH